MQNFKTKNINQINILPLHFSPLASFVINFLEEKGKSLHNEVQFISNTSNSRKTIRGADDKSWIKSMKWIFPRYNQCIPRKKENPDINQDRHFGKHTILSSINLSVVISFGYTKNYKDWTLKTANLVTIKLELFQAKTLDPQKTIMIEHLQHKRNPDHKARDHKTIGILWKRRS